MKDKLWVLWSWALLGIVLIGICMFSNGGNNAIALTLIIGSIIWLYSRISLFGFGPSFLFGNEKKTTCNSMNDPQAPQKKVKPYPMESDAANAAIGAVDKCCEFAAYCEKYVIPAGACSPEKLEGYIMATPQAISFGFTWKTFYYTLDFLIEKQGYTIHGEGFSFSDNSGMVLYQRQIMSNDVEYEAAYAWMMDTPTSEIIAYFERIAENNFTSLGVNSHSASCHCTHSEGNKRSFEFTV